MTATPGSRLGPYEILSPLGAGGMGEVYRAKDPKLGREIAIKVLPAAVGDDRGRRQRFEQEARSASALNHPNILTVYDIGEADGALYIAMELVEGKTLRELLASGEPLPTKRLLDLAVQIAEGLAKAHSAGIVHRDLKPENLMVSKDGYVKILDFGLAKLTEPVSAQGQSALPTAIAAPTEPGTVMGTVGYMSPEQASGQPLDFRSDQFSLGAILYEMATGKRAFQRKTSAETLTAIIREEPEPLSQAAPKAPAPVRWIVERLLAKDPEERYASTKDLARDLKSIRDHLTETAVSGAFEPAVPVKARRRGWLLPTALAFLAGAGLALVAAKKLDLIGPPQLEFQRLTFRRGVVHEARFAPDGKTVLYGAAWDGEPSGIFSTSRESPESRSLGLPQGSLLAVSKTGELAVSLGWHPTFGWESSGTLARVPISGGAPREVLEDVQDVDWSPQGDALAVIHRVEDRARLEYPPGTVIAQSPGWLSHPRVSPDGKTLAYFEHPERGDNAGRLVFYDLIRKTMTTGPSFGGFASYTWTPQGDILGAYSGGLFRVSTSGKQRALINLAGIFLPLDMAPDGTLLAKRANRRREIVAVGPDGKERNLTWLDWSFPVDISDDGQTILFDEQSRGRENYYAYVRKTDGSQAVQLAKAKGFGLSRDGRWALMTNPTADELTLVPTGAGNPRTFPKAGLHYEWGHFFPDGKNILLFAGEPGHSPRLFVQALDGGKPRPITKEEQHLAPALKAIGPDGQLAVTDPDGKVFILTSDGAGPRPTPCAVPGADQLSGWGSDGHSLYLVRGTIPARVEICDTLTGALRLWKEIVPPDPAGVLTVDPVFITPDGKSYVYSYRRQLDELALVKGLR
ncbi:MAG TPA: protein kinase [Thermoanaerobaculia bacterium]|nr:protein kinase [Thermoanaerobaculia bacterium]